jgi:hypothetical protein
VDVTIGAGADFAYCPGFSLNFARQRSEQKKYLALWWSTLLSGFPATVIPQTGSTWLCESVAITECILAAFVGGSGTS